MEKQMYRIIDSRGRVYLPKELRLSLDLEADSFVKLIEDEGNLQLWKVHLIELRGSFPQSSGGVCFGGCRYAQKEAASPCRPTAGTKEDVE